MRRIISFVGAAMIAAPVLLLGSSASAQDAAAGEEAFLRVGCYTCHGYEGQGANTGPKIAPGPLAYEAFSTFMRQTAGAMPPYTPQALPEEDLRDIYAYLESIPDNPDPASIPLLQQLQ